MYYVRYYEKGCSGKVLEKSFDTHTAAIKFQTLIGIGYISTTKK